MMGTLRQLGTAMRRRLGRTRYWVAAAFRSGLWARGAVARGLRKNSWVAQRLRLPAGAMRVAAAAAQPGAGVTLTELAPAGRENVAAPPRTNCAANAAFFAKSGERRWDATWCATIENGFAHGFEAGQFLTAGRQHLTDLGLEHWMYYHRSFMSTRLRLPRPRQHDGTVAVVAHRSAYANFGHWVVNVLPRIEVLRRAGEFDRIDRFAVGWTGARYQRESLAALGVPMDRCERFGPGDFLQARRLVVPTHQRYEHVANAPWVTDWLRRTFVPAARGPRKRRLFISRRDASFRRLLQEDELCARLARLGFERVTMTGVGVRESAALFNEAEVIAGVFGSGLISAVFCEPGTKLIEIATPAFYNCYHWFIAVESGLEPHVYFGGDGVIREERALHAGHEDISIDPADCARFIEDAL